MTILFRIREIVGNSMIESNEWCHPNFFSSDLTCPYGRLISIQERKLYAFELELPWPAILEQSDLK